MDPHALAALIETALREGKPFPLLATGNSMYPFLRSHRDSVVLTASGGRPFRRGEIVLFRRRGQPPESTYVLHRVLRVLPDGGLVMNGDAQVWTETIRPEQVLGTVSKLVRDGREISCSSPCYRVLSGLWRLTRPLRGPLSRVYLKLHGKDGMKQ